MTLAQFGTTLVPQQSWRFPSSVFTVDNLDGSWTAYGKVRFDPHEGVSLETLGPAGNPFVYAILLTSRQATP